MALVETSHVDNVVKEVIGDMVNRTRQANSPI